jgi:plasmid stabilization system protein ParE
MPSSLKVRFTPEARADFVDTLQWACQELGDEGMRVYADLVLKCLADHEHFAVMYEPRDELPEGLWDCASGQHTVFYVVSDDGVTACRIIHDRHIPFHNFGI